MMTRCPSRASSVPAVDPAGPPPMIATSYFSSIRRDATQRKMPPQRVSLKPAGDIARPVGDDEIRPGPAERSHHLHHHRLLIEPAEARGGFHCRVLPTHAVHCHGHAEALFHP